MKINENGIVRDMTGPEEALYMAELEKLLNSSQVIISKIELLKAELASLDYKTLKWIEGYYTDEEYAPYKVKKQELRSHINELELNL